MPQGCRGEVNARWPAVAEKVGFNTLPLNIYIWQNQQVLQALLWVRGLLEGRDQKDLETVLQGGKPPPLTSVALALG